MNQVLASLYVSVLSSFIRKYNSIYIKNVADFCYSDIINEKHVFLAYIFIRLVRTFTKLDRSLKSKDW